MDCPHVCTERSNSGSDSFSGYLWACTKADRSITLLQNFYCNTLIFYCLLCCICLSATEYPIFLKEVPRVWALEWICEFMWNENEHLREDFRDEYRLVGLLCWFPDFNPRLTQWDFCFTLKDVVGHKMSMFVLHSRLELLLMSGYTVTQTGFWGPI